MDDVALKQVWRDEDGLTWVIVAIRPEGIYVKRMGYPHSQTIQTNPAWLDRWTKLVESDGSPAQVAS